MAWQTPRGANPNDISKTKKLNDQLENEQRRRVGQWAERERKLIRMAEEVEKRGNKGKQKLDEVVADVNEKLADKQAELAGDYLWELHGEDLERVVEGIARANELARDSAKAAQDSWKNVQAEEAAEPGPLRGDVLGAAGRIEAMFMLFVGMDKLLKHLRAAMRKRRDARKRAAEIKRLETEKSRLIELAHREADKVQRDAKACIDLIDQARAEADRVKAYAFLGRRTR